MYNNTHKKFSPNMALVVHFSPIDGCRVSSPNPYKKNLIKVKVEYQGYISEKMVVSGH